MGIEYMAAIRKDDYNIFRFIITTELPAKYEVWLQIIKRRRLKAFQERGITVHDIEISPIDSAIIARKWKALISVARHLIIARARKRWREHR